MNEELESIDIVSRAVDRITKHGRYADFELTNGIVLTIKPVPPLLLQAISKEFQPPLPPKVYLEDRGREEENPSDPKYLRDMAEFEEKQNLALNNLLLGVGTAFKSVPEGYFPPSSDEWIPSVEFAASLAGQEITINRDDGVQRYLCWLRFYALETASDAALATSLSYQLGGIQEDEVAEVIDSFRSIPERGTDTDSVPEAGSSNGDNSNRASRRASARTGRA